MSLSGQHKDAAQVQRWLNDCNQSFTYEATHHVSVIFNGGFVDPRFPPGTLEDDINDYFRGLRSETELLATLDIIASVEAAIRVDFINRADKHIKDSSGLADEFKVLRKKKKAKVSLEEDILDAWKRHAPEVKPRIDDFGHVLDYRHWLAHGRYWLFKAKIPKNGGAPPTFIEAKNVSEKLILALKSSVFGFHPNKV
ncbi:hypothetical protein [Burkholderia sp. Se-20378]|uniref:hypothetical protein n=1 Tax=Burkholderia sp. Se-20378 TaxID=2703899 RepID=UPI0019818719|nr:hypothetical protein [Burkholderia sp. Se-20378]MBN3768330.1 hypothetical protein [Burkholderia sp. Se-20378]